MDFPMDIWVFLICFINVLFKIITYFKFDQGLPSEAYFITG
jgi:hypothetical protein